MSDSALLSLPGFGSGCLRYVRSVSPPDRRAVPPSSGGGVVAAVEVELAGLRGRAPELADSALAALALALAGEIDSPGNSATSKAMCAGSLQKALDRLRELAPAAEVADGIAGLQARAGLKLAGSA